MHQPSSIFKIPLLLLFLLSILSATALLPTTKITEAATVAELQAQINDRNAKLQVLQKEIESYQAQLSTVSSQSKNLQGNIKTLDATKKKLEKEIALAQGQITATNLEIRKLSIEIDDKKNDITQNSNAVAQSLRELNQTESNSFISVFLGNRSMATFLNSIAEDIQVQKSISAKVEVLKDLKAQLEDSVNQSKEKEQQLERIKIQLGDKKNLVVYDQQQKNKLLSQTKNQESNYQKIIAQKKAQAAAFDAELNDFESQLKLAIDPKSIPSTKAGVLSWPVDRVVLTQSFGNTAFAKAHASAYNGNGHNGIDLGVSIGNNIKAALGGIVKGIGDTDTVCPSASYGKWVLVEHPNGLTTLYAHLSIIKVSSGQQVSTGELLGYSGQTGYATGPHLHFTVYASQGVRILQRQSKVCGGAYTMPIADLSAYLNPLSYLPSLN